MASTPSASALSAVLRCRGNIWTRNPPTKRPASSAYSLGLAGGSPAERARSNQATAWEAFLQGDRVLVGRRLTVAFKSPPRVKDKDCREINKLCHPKLSQSARDARSAVPSVQNALVRQLARRLTHSHNLQKIKYKTYATHICQIICVQETSDFPAGVFKVSIMSPCLVGNEGQIPSFVITGWSTLKSTCLSLTALVSEFMLLKLAVLWISSSSPDDTQQNIRNNTLQANGHIHSPTDLISSKENSGQMIPEDRPD
ncbi:uncharacterized protein LOC117265633 [Epinephelus lanceolatus]|uniref:uncharacterized protein LOC117265633 n=1 Tax=Epinephelus lanceolatus TaxID=310571 RepID=UPI00144865BE|nr:uncharacterized protein LOC117265633 [Epinephelus lanceolatus]